MSDRSRPSSTPGLDTLGIHAGAPPPAAGEPVVPPVVLSATFYGGGPEDEGELRYTRYGNNPTQVRLGEKLAALEGTEAALPLGSGMAALSMTFLALTRAGGHLVASRELYGATRQLLAEELPRRGVETTFVDPGNPREWREALRDDTRALFLEIPTNPTLRFHDPRPIARLAHERGLVLVVDATFASPVLLRSVDIGVDVVVHSATKYLGGHSDLIAGVVASKRSVIEEVREMAKLYGPALDPHGAWLLDRGLRTLGARMRRHCENALELARWFESRPEVARVHYPGLASHPSHDLATELLRGYGGMLSVVLKGGGGAADRFCSSLELALLAPSLGGVETLVSQPRHTSHVGLSPEEREAVGIRDGFVRISVGLEDPRDLKEDFEGALTRR